MAPQLRAEREQDHSSIAEVIRVAFLAHPRSDGSEPRIVDRLRARGELAVALVAELEGRVVGHVAFSPVELNPACAGWYGLGPLAVHPAVQGQGIGSLLVNRGLAELRSRGARGCVVFGNPAYYGRFRFVACEQLAYPEEPPGYFLALAFQGEVPQATVSYSPAFYGT